jgi:hypothetical protein
MSLKNKKNKSLWLVLSLTFVLSFSQINNIKACWNNGGEITYTNVGKDSFAVKITLYTYCSAFNPQSFNLTYKCKTTNQILGSVNIPRRDIYPNPCIGQTNFSIDLDDEKDVQVQIYSANGQLVDEIYLNGVEGNNLVQFDTQKLKKGLYLCKVIANNKLMETKNLIVN